MKLNEVKEPGFYKSNDIILEVFKDDKLQLFKYERDTEIQDDGTIKYITDNCAYSLDNERFANIEVEKVEGFTLDKSTLFFSTISYGLTYKEKLERIEKLCKKVSKEMIYTQDSNTLGSDCTLQFTDKAIFAQEILNLLK